MIKGVHKNSDRFILSQTRVVGIVVGKWTNFEYYPFNQVHMGSYRFKRKSSLSVLYWFGRVRISSENRNNSVAVRD